MGSSGNIIKSVLLGSFSKKFISLFISFEMAILSPMSALAQAKNQNSKVNEGVAPDEQTLKDDLQLAHWGRLDSEMPWLTEFALGEPITTNNEPLWKIDENSAVLDQDPFFLRSQSWTELSVSQKSQLSDCKSICATKSSEGDLLLSFTKQSKALKLNQKFSALLETEDRIFLSADNNQIFKDKTAGSKEPGEGVFFINKNDLKNFSVQSQAVPVFHFPLVGAGWTTPEIKAAELPGFNQISFVAKDGFQLNVESEDIAQIEDLSRKNFLLLQVVTFVTKGPDERGMAFPEPKSTMAFGLIATGIIPKSTAGHSSLKKSELEGLKSLFIEKAYASEKNDTTVGAKIKARAKKRLEQLDNPEQFAKEKEQTSTWKRWIPPTLFYGGTAALAYGAAQEVDWGALITKDLPGKVITVASIFGVVLVAGIIMRYTIHRDHFNKLYPTNEKDTLLQKVNREHKAILDEMVHGLRFVSGAPWVGILHSLEYLKDKFVPGNKMINDAWSATMGFFIRTSSQLPINWKCFYLGAIVFGMSDATMVAVDLLIFTPFLIKALGITSIAAGSVAAAFVSATLLEQFSLYLRTGAVSYSADVKQINQLNAEKDAKRILVTQGKDPEDPNHANEVNKLANESLQKTFKSLGLPGPESFLYDSITVLEKVIGKSGFSTEQLKNLSDEDKAKLAKLQSSFVLKTRRWGLVTPALQKAISTAELANSQASSEVGEKTIEMLKWAMANKGFTAFGTVKSVAGKVKQVVTSTDRPAELEDMINEELLRSSLDKSTNVMRSLSQWETIYAGIKGTLRYVVSDDIQKVKDIRMVLYLMSTTRSYKEVINFLPKSWIDRAGSKEVAQVAAELFHREFMAFYQSKPHISQPDTHMFSQYSSRAETVINEQAKEDSSLSDPFTRKIRWWSVIQKLHDEDAKKIDTLTYEPEELSYVEKQQWERARAEAEIYIKSVDNDRKVSKVWLDTAKTYQSKMEDKDTFEGQSWINNYKRKLIFATQIAKQTGLLVSDIKDSELVREVLIMSATETDSQLNTENNKSYLKTLSPEDREYYEARIFYHNFVANYINKTVHSDTFDAGTKEYPGRFQAVRASLIDSGKNKTLVSVVKAVEAIFRNDASAYTPGLEGKLSRNVPLLPDFYHNFSRGLRSWPFSLTVGYLMSYFIWQVHMPYAMLVFGLAFSFTHPTMVEINNRIMRNFNIKPMDDVPSKLTYSFIHSRLTNPQIMFELAFAGAIVAFLSAQNLVIGAGTAATFFAGKYAYDKFKGARKDEEKKSKVERVDGEIKLKVVKPTNCLMLFAN